MAQSVRPAAGSPREIAGYEILKELGHGGMGKVYQARQAGLDRIVALKVLAPDLAEDENFIERFQQEARATAKLNHPNIVQGIDVGQDEQSGLWYFAMEYVDGPSLSDVLERDGGFIEERALRIARDLCAALECAHRNGFVHRDVKPANVLLASSGVAKLADLGLAKRPEAKSDVTQEFASVGTPHYMAPEQAGGKNEAIDIRTDLYGLGATLFHMIAGRPPFAGESPAVVMVKQIAEKAPPVSKFAPRTSDGCAKLIAKLLQKDPKQRVQTPAELRVELERLLGLEPSEPLLPPGGIPETSLARERGGSGVRAASGVRSGSGVRAASNPSGSGVRAASNPSGSGLRGAVKGPAGSGLRNAVKGPAGSGVRAALKGPAGSQIRNAVRPDSHPKHAAATRPAGSQIRAAVGRSTGKPGRNEREKERGGGKKRGLDTTTKAVWVAAIVLLLMAGVAVWAYATGRLEKLIRNDVPQAEPEKTDKPEKTEKSDKPEKSDK